MRENGTDERDVAEGPAESAERSAERREQERTPEAAFEEAASFDAAVERMPEDLKVAADARLRDIVADADIPPDERADIPGLEEAGKALRAAQRDADRLRSKTRSLLASPLAKIKRLAAAAAGAALISGAPLSAARAERPGAPAAEAMKAPEPAREAARPAPEKVHAESIAMLDADKALADQVGPENIKVLREALGWFEQRKIDKAAADLAGIDPSFLAEESAREIRIYSEEEIERIRKTEDKSFFVNAATAETRKDRILLRASKLVDAKGRVSLPAVEETLMHEQMHVYSTSGEAETADWTEKAAVSGQLYEGVTELLAQRATGMTSPEQAYPGGPLEAAYLLERLVGTKTLAEEYLTGDTQALKAALSKKIGADGAEAVLRRRNDPAMAMVFGSPEGLSAANEILARCKDAGIDTASFAAQAEADGIQERMHVAEKGAGLMLMKERGGKLMFTGLLEDASRLTPHSPPIRLHLSLTRGELAGGTPRFLPHELKKMSAFAEEMSADVAKDAGGRPSPAEWERQAASMFPEFQVTVNVGAELAALVKAREAATDGKEKSRLEGEIAAKAEKTGREFMARVRAAVEKEK